MNQEEKMNKIHLEVLSRIKPKKEEYSYLQEEFETIENKIQIFLKKKEITASIELGGSFSRDTWLAGDRDLDIFIKLPYESKVEAEELTQQISEELDYKWEKRHANHPYLYTKYNGLELEIIPSYTMVKGRKIRSPVDRSLLHKEFVKENLPIGANDEVRLLKQFMKGIGTYGAEIKIHGFSGYLLELLMIKFKGQFIEVLQNATKLLDKPITFKEKIAIKKEKFVDDSIIVIDPTDSERNVASAVKKQTLYEFIAAANHYLRYPSIDFFFPKKVNITEEKISEIKTHPLVITIIEHKKPAVVPDVLWGQIRRFENSLENYLLEKELQPLILDTLEIEKVLLTAIVTIQDKTPKIKWHTGPPIDNNGQKEFLEKYLENKKVLFGPTIRSNRWGILLKKEPKEIRLVIKEALKKKQIAIPSHLSLHPKDIKLLTKYDVIQKYANNQKALTFLYKLMRNRPNYLS